MSKLRVLLSDEKKLRKKARKIKELTPEIHRLIDDMVETMTAENGVGLAAPQVGESVELIVVRIPEDFEEEQDPGKLHVLINPRVVRKGGAQSGYEGCLSVPGYKAVIERAEHVLVKALDRKLNPVELKARGLLSRALQHEIDHLKGILYIDYLDDLSALEPLEDEEGNLEKYDSRASQLVAD